MYCESARWRGLEPSRHDVGMIPNSMRTGAAVDVSCLFRCGRSSRAAATRADSRARLDGIAAVVARAPATPVGATTTPRRAGAGAGAGAGLDLRDLALLASQRRLRLHPRPRRDRVLGTRKLLAAVRRVLGAGGSGSASWARPGSSSREPLAVTAWDAGDQAVDAEPSQVVVHLPGGGDRACREGRREKAAWGRRSYPARRSLHRVYPGWPHPRRSCLYGPVLGHPFEWRGVLIVTKRVHTNQTSAVPRRR